MKFINFLKDEFEYDAAEKYWADLFEEFNNELPAQEKWVSWFETFYGNGVKLKSGNPIITRWNHEKQRAFRVIQEEAESDDEFHIGAWMDKFDDTGDQLVISCVLSDRVEKIIRQLLEAFVVRKFSINEMKILIDKLLD